MTVVDSRRGTGGALLSRFAALYSAGRLRYTISYPGDPAALALPMATGPVLRGEQVAGSAWQSLPVPALIGLQVQPRSMSLFRAEQVAPLGGPIALSDDGGSVVNATGLDLRDAVLVGPRGEQTPLGTIPPGGSVPVTGPAGSPTSAADLSRAGGWIDPEILLAGLRDYRWPRPED